MIYISVNKGIPKTLVKRNPKLTATPQHRVQVVKERSRLEGSRRISLR